MYIRHVCTTNDNALALDEYALDYEIILSLVMCNHSAHKVQFSHILSR